MNIKLYNPESAESRESLSVLTGIQSDILAKWEGSNAPGVKAEMDEDGNYVDYSPLVKSKSGKYFLNIDGPIVTGGMANFLYYFLGISAVSGESVRIALDNFDGTELTVRINSPGGIVTEASSIYDSIVRLGKSGVEIKTNITGLAASSATLIMLATKEIEMSPLGILFIHSAHTTISGNQFTMRAEAELLEKFDNSMAKMYAERMGSDDEYALAIMSKQTDAPEGRGTWLSADEALDVKLISSVLSQEDEEDEEDVDPIKALLPEGDNPDLNVTFAGDLARFKAMSFILNSAR